MQTSHFDRALLPPARTFYERELEKLSRPDRKGWAMGNCPFHKCRSGRSFSVSLEHGGFRCFGCDAKGGDVLAFVRLRDRLDFKQAAQSLGAWRVDMSPAETERLRRIQQERERHRLEEIRQKDFEIAHRRSVLGELHATRTLYREACEEHENAKAFA
jgi:DNA primase